MVRHLAGLGHRRIAIIRGAEQNFDAAERLRGYRAAVAEFGLEADAPRPAVADGQVVILGLRPEALLLRGKGQGAFTARVEEVVPLGSETLLTLDAARVALTVRIDGLVVVSRGEAMEFAVPASGWHWFDGTSETRLT